jgi:hypothetical protein
MRPLHPGCICGTFRCDVRIPDATSGRLTSLRPSSYLASELTSITYPSGRVVAQSFDNIGRLSQITSSSVNYLTVASSSGYNAANEVLSATYGNGVAATFVRLQRAPATRLAGLRQIRRQPLQPGVQLRRRQQRPDSEHHR